MKLFLSWSKEPARSIALELREIIPMIVRQVQPWMSEVDIQKGNRWSNEIAQVLDQTDTGIIIVTPTNLAEPWLFFEAGALSKSVGNGKVHPLVVGVEKHDLVGPLGQFQATQFNRDDFLELLQAINRGLPSPESEREITGRFDRVWDGLAAKVLAEVSASSHQSKAASSPPPVPRGADSLVINDEQERILKFLVDAGAGNPRQALEAEQIAANVSMHVERTKDHLDVLVKANYLSIYLSMIHPPQYAIGTHARKYAMNKGWI